MTANAATCRARRQRLVAAGLCIRCGRSPSRPGVTTCADCGARDRSYVAGRYRSIRKHRETDRAHALDVNRECKIQRGICCDQSWRRGDVGDRTVGNVCPGCGRVREIPPSAHAVGDAVSNWRVD